MLREINRILRHRTSFRRTASSAGRQFHDPPSSNYADSYDFHFLSFFGRPRTNNRYTHLTTYLLDHVSRSFVVTQTHETAMPEVTVRGPLRKLKLPDQNGP